MTELLQSVSVLQYLVFFIYSCNQYLNINNGTHSHVYCKRCHSQVFFFSIINLARTCRVFLKVVNLQKIGDQLVSPCQ